MPDKIGQLAASSVTNAKLQLGSAVVIVTALTAVAVALSDSVKVGVWFGAALVAILIGAVLERSYGGTLPP